MSKWLKGFVEIDRGNDFTDHFKNKVALVTGGASGIGRALCKELGQRGAVVIVADINVKGAQQVSATITAVGGRARAAHLDVSQAKAVQKLIDETISEYGRLDYMFNNAGIAIMGEVRHMNLEHWHRLIGVNLWGVINGTTAAYQVMVKQGFGHIVNTASGAGLVPFPMATAYSTAKHGVVGLSTSLRAEAAKLGVRVSVVCPGLVQTGIYETVTVQNVRREDMLDLIEDLLVRTPFRMTSAIQIARAILRGVVHNQAVIIFPFHARLMWWLYRLHSVFLAPLYRIMVERFRALHREP